MTIDERLEALTQSVELMAQMQKKTEENVNSLAKSTKRIERVGLLFAAEFHLRLQKLEDEIEREDDSKEST